MTIKSEAVRSALANVPVLAAAESFQVPPMQVVEDVLAQRSSQERKNH